MAVDPYDVYIGTFTSGSAKAVYEVLEATDYRWNFYLPHRGGERGPDILTVRRGHIRIRLRGQKMQVGYHL